MFPPVLIVVISILAAYLTATLVARAAETVGFPLPKSVGRMGCIDGLRGYLALSVLVHHYLVWTQVIRGDGLWHASGQPIVNQLGAGAVGFFFMITGFVFYKRVLAGFRNTSWVAIYITRVFRIMPLLIASIVAVITIASFRAGRFPSLQDARGLARWITAWGEPDLVGYHDTGRINAYVLWSLRFEWLFYIFVLPVAALAMDMTRGYLASAWVPAALFVIATAYVYVPQLSILYYLPLFATGMLAYEARQRATLASWLRHPISSFTAAGALITATLIFAVPISWGLLAFVLFFMCVASGNSFFGLFETRGAIVLGEISFSIYLLHGLMLSLLFTEGQSLLSSIPTGALPLILPAVSIVVTLVACMTYITVERPAMRLGSYLVHAWT